MTDPIGWRETTDTAPSAGQIADGAALRFDPSRRVMLRFQIALHDDDELEGLRYARRAMIREERTCGLEWDEPSMEDPTLTGSEIRWFALASQAAWCRQKVGELIDRANRVVTDIREGRGSRLLP